MTTSENLSNLAKALQVFHLKVDDIKKDAKNPFFKSTYATLSNILESIKDPLNESGLILTQFPSGNHGLVTMLIHSESGEFILSEYEMKPVKDTPQERGSCLTYQRRYCICSVLLLNIMEDDDANVATYGNSNSPKEDNKQWLNKGSEQFNKALDYISKGGKMSAIKEKYKVSKEVEKLLLQSLTYETSGTKNV